MVAIITTSSSAYLLCMVNSHLLVSHTLYLVSLNCHTHLLRTQYSTKQTSISIALLLVTILLLISMYYIITPLLVIIHMWMQSEVTLGCVWVEPRSGNLGLAFV